ncbi:unnamed protein product [Rotaria magnacalcarata]|uniref:RNA-dependent RNA polymerase n=2 Tax=Rotaria magnacalcarata TaxID=392030 RepID=A0A819IHH7_9BILA|nr:unnamed protein product [Rotaria magnacalcarata]CAF3917070.1 unnamed protein product [Rotaria magnacalcarata]
MFGTFTYQERHALQLRPQLAILEKNFEEQPSRKFWNIIRGLTSRSFRFQNEEEMNIISGLFNDSPVWFQKRLEVNNEIVPSAYKSSDLMDISFGYLLSTHEYCWRTKVAGRNLLTWETNVNQKHLIIKHEASEFILNQDCLDKYFIILNSQFEKYGIILPLKTSPRCYASAQRRNSSYRQRRLEFDCVDGVCLANSSALSLTFRRQMSLEKAKEFLVTVLKLDYLQGNINCRQMSAQPMLLDQPLSDFWSSYAFQMLMALGDRIKHRLTADTLKKIKYLSNLSDGEQYPNHRCYLKLTAVYYRARFNRFFDINEDFDNIQPLPSSVVLDKWVYVPRIFLTPYGIYPLPVKPMRGNRILREEERFGPGKNFCRVIIRDVDCGQPQLDFMKINEKWIQDMIMAKNNIQVGDQKFEFLWCSNSQLRDRSFWFHSDYKGCQAKNIREWMGDFSHEKCIGTRIARMALSLTGTTPTLKLLPNQIEKIDDVLDTQGRIFTDGAGKISPMALKEAFMIYNPELIEDNYMPCVIQARLNGIKGVFVIAPDLSDRGILIQYRPSQYKFSTDHNILEIVKHSSSGMTFLNRQVIVLIENMGVSKHIFVKLQNKARMKISMSLLANQQAQHTLEQHVRCYDWERIRQAGTQLTREQFPRSLLLLLAQERLTKLKEKSHVQIPLTDGRMLLGVVDETMSLQYGQVFIQLRNLNGQSDILKDRNILITKNPAHFPGDIRKLVAVDCPALHYLYDCVVFPAKGVRPHPNEISGSDIDGDEYWVCWNEDLVNHATLQHEPATFDSAEKVKHDGEITIAEIADFLFKYLSSDSLGALSNRHLACCAINGPGDDKSCRLAKIISEAVDFPKTGVLPVCPKDLSFESYPDFMENKFKKSFISDSSIGIMFREVKQVCEIHAKWQDENDDNKIDINRDFLVKDFRKYITQSEVDYKYYASRVNAILSSYDLKTEYELITGCHSCVQEERQNSDSIETASLEFRQLMKEMRTRFDDDQLNYREKLRKTSAWYYVAYKAGTILSFGWIMDRFMSEILKAKNKVQEEHQALIRIGEAIRLRGLENGIKKLADLFRVENAEQENQSETAKLGFQFLEIIEKCSQSVDKQTLAHNLLAILHEVALNI